MISTPNQHMHVHTPPVYCGTNAQAKQLVSQQPLKYGFYKGGASARAQILPGALEGRTRGGNSHRALAGCSAALVHDKRILTSTLRLILTLTPTPTLTRRAAARAAVTPLSGSSASAASPAWLLFPWLLPVLVLQRMRLDCRAARPTTRTAWLGVQARLLGHQTGAVEVNIYSNCRSVPAIPAGPLLTCLRRAVSATSSCGRTVSCG